MGDSYTHLVRERVAGEPARDGVLAEEPAHVDDPVR